MSHTIISKRAGQRQCRHRASRQDVPQYPHSLLSGAGSTCVVRCSTIAAIPPARPSSYISQNTLHPFNPPRRNDEPRTTTIKATSQHYNLFLNFLLVVSASALPSWKRSRVTKNESREARTKHSSGKAWETYHCFRVYSHKPCLQSNAMDTPLCPLVSFSSPSS